MYLYLYIVQYLQVLYIVSRKYIRYTRNMYAVRIEIYPSEGYILEMRMRIVSRIVLVIVDISKISLDDYERSFLHVLILN